MKLAITILLVSTLGVGAYLMYCDSNYLGLPLSKELSDSLTERELDLLVGLRSAHMYNNKSGRRVIKTVSVGCDLMNTNKTIIDGSSSGYLNNDDWKLATGSGIAFKSIKGELYAYASGDVALDPVLAHKMVAVITDCLSSLKKLKAREADLITIIE